MDQNLGTLTTKSQGRSRFYQRLWNSRSGAIFLLGLISALSLGGYLAYSNAVYRSGFPLDDAWIHQTYARNLALTGQMAFFPGQPSAGSTAPAWTVLLALGHLLRINELAWAYFLGWILLWGLAAIAWAGFGMLGFTGRSWGLAAGFLLAVEWHLVWAAGSGMETLLQAVLILLVLAGSLWLEKSERQQKPVARAGWPWLLVGGLVGLSAWVRPDGLTLLVLVGWVAALGAWPTHAKLRIAIYFMAGFTLLFLPYLWFNLQLAGEVWPNTFYAKQAEYAVLRAAPLWQRGLAEFYLPLIGVGILLLPGLIISIAWCLHKRYWPALGGVLWLIGYLGIYALRLPVTYQHGRYIIPAMPVFFLYGLAGLAGWHETIPASRRASLLNRTWSLACIAILLCFWVIGARSYAWDVAVIETEMVSTARWVSRNIPAGARLAAHDIGALGYFGGRGIVDLAGLVSPEVIPFIRDEDALESFLREENVDYLVTFPGWYPNLTRRFESFYTSSGTFSPMSGGENMVVFRWDAAESGN